MNNLPIEQRTPRRLMQLGVLLFLLGLLTGLVIPVLSNPRMGLSSHLEGVMNGTFLVVLGLIWPRLRVSRRTGLIAFGLAVYGTYVNWATTLGAAAWGAGTAMMPISGMGYEGSPVQEAIVTFGLVSLAVSMIVTCVIVVWGLRGEDGD